MQRRISCLLRVLGFIAHENSGTASPVINGASTLPNPVKHDRAWIDEPALEHRNGTTNLVKRVNSEDDRDNLLEILYGDDDDDDGRVLELLRWRERSPRRETTHEQENVEDIIEVDRWLAEEYAIRGAAARQAASGTGGEPPSPTSAHGASYPTVPTAGPHPERASYMIEEAKWISAPVNFDPLPQYPNQQEVNQLLDRLHEQFFKLFETQVPVDSRRFDILFGGSGGNQYTCRVSWKNPGSWSYPDNTMRMPDVFFINPEDYLVIYSNSKTWKDDEMEYPLPTTQLRRNIMNYDPKWRPTLMHYLEMRLMSRFKGERWAWGMGAMLRTVDARFAFGYRVYLTQGNIPSDSRRHGMLVRKKDQHREILQSLVELMYGRPSRGRSRTSLHRRPLPER